MSFFNSKYLFLPIVTESYCSTVLQCIAVHVYICTDVNILSVYGDLLTLLTSFA